VLASCSKVSWAAIPLWRRAHAKLAKRLTPDLARRLAVEAEGLARE